jgi:hypothetical protein
MFYVYIEDDNTIVSILDYIGTIPSNTKMFEITDEEYKSITDLKSYFNIKEKKVVPNTTKMNDDINIKENNLTNKRFLNTSDWKILRHSREKTLGITTSLTNAEYLELEQQRYTAANAIKP